MWAGLLSLPVRLLVIGLAAWWLYRLRRHGRISIIRQHVLLVACVLTSGWVLYPLGSWLDGDSWGAIVQSSGPAVANELWAIPMVGFAAYHYTKAMEARNGEQQQHELERAAKDSPESRRRI